MKKEFNLTATDMVAIRDGANGYLTNKGAKLYKEDTYYQSVEYYRLAAAMGEVQSISNLGYCYLYGRDIEQNTSVAIAYFTIAANRENVDAAYKLGDIYGSDKWGVKDKELSLYYYNLAADYLIEADWREGYTVAWEERLNRYPSLCFALARETFPGGDMNTDIKISYEFLKHAEYGYDEAIKNGDDFYEAPRQAVLDMLECSEYDGIREEIDKIFVEEYGKGEEDEDIEPEVDNIDHNHLKDYYLETDSNGDQYLVSKKSESLVNDSDSVEYFKDNENDLLIKLDLDTGKYYIFMIEIYNGEKEKIWCSPEKYDPELRDVVMNYDFSKLEKIEDRQDVINYVNDYLADVILNYDNED